MEDKNVLNDMLLTEKFMIDMYSQSVNKCVNDKVRDDLISVIYDEYKMYFEIIDEIEKRGYSYKIDLSQDKIKNLIDQVKQK